MVAQKFQQEKKGRDYARRRTRSSCRGAGGCGGGTDRRGRNGGGGDVNREEMYLSAVYTSSESTWTIFDSFCIYCQFLAVAILPS